MQKSILCQCNLPLLWNEKFHVYICTNCGDLADRNGNKMIIPFEQKLAFVNKVKVLQKEILELSFLKDNSKQINPIDQT